MRGVNRFAIACFGGALALVSLRALPAQQAENFPDVDPDHWAASAVARLKEKGILKGYPDATPARQGGQPQASGPLMALRDPREVHLKNVRQLTFGGQNAEAYWSFDGKKITFQSMTGDMKCDQIFTMNADGSDKRMVSTGKGRCTCSYWLKDGKRILFSSTHAISEDCPPPVDRSKGYVWPVYPIYTIYTVKPDGSDIQPLFPRGLKPGEEPGYNAESTISTDGKRIVFTSSRGGDIDIWTMDIDGRNARQLTKRLGYEGGPYFSPDGKKICFRAGYPETEAEIAEYKDLLAQHLVKPLRMDLYVMNADGSGQRRVTNDAANGVANFAPYFTPDGKKLIFTSNIDDPKRRKFEVYLINVDGTGRERITFGDQFDGFPMFDPKGKRLVWASNRNGQNHETNIFVADWVP